MKYSFVFYIIESGSIITPVRIVKQTKSYTIVKFANGGGIRIPNNRLFKSKEEAESFLRNKKL